VRQGTEDGRQGTETKTGDSGRVARNRDVRQVPEDGRQRTETYSNSGDIG